MIRLAVLAAVLLFQEQDQPEEGKPLSCDNFAQTDPAHRCQCGKAMQKCEGMPQPPPDVSMDQKCLTFCRAQNCRCAGHGCRS